MTSIPTKICPFFLKLSPISLQIFISSTDNSVATAFPPTCILDLISPFLGILLIAPKISPSKRMILLSPLLTSGINSWAIKGSEEFIRKSSIKETKFLSSLSNLKTPAPPFPYNGFKIIVP